MNNGRKKLKKKVVIRQEILNKLLRIIPKENLENKKMMINKEKKIINLTNLVKKILSNNNKINHLVQTKVKEEEEVDLLKEILIAFQEVEVNHNKQEVSKVDNLEVLLNLIITEVILEVHLLEIEDHLEEISVVLQGEIKEVIQEDFQEIIQEVFQEDLQEAIQEDFQGAIQEDLQEVIQEELQEDFQEVIQEAIQEASQEVIQEDFQEEEVILEVTPEEDLEAEVVHNDFIICCIIIQS